jgi:HPt (histidine-containing phosphotransfer) domain-containing protein
LHLAHSMNPTPGSIDTRDVVSVCHVGGVLDRRLLREMLVYFIDENERRIATSAQALAAGNRRNLTEAAHALRGSAGLFGAGRLYDLAWALEIDAAHEDLTGLCSRLDALQQEYRSVVSALQTAHPEAWEG